MKAGGSLTVVVVESLSLLPPSPALAVLECCWQDVVLVFRSSFAVDFHNITVNGAETPYHLPGRMHIDVADG